MVMSRLSLVVAVCLTPAYAFLVSVPQPARYSSPQCRRVGEVFATAVDPAFTAPLSATGLEPKKIPLEKDRLESERGIDYVPLANMLLTGDFKSADQFTRDTLIRLAGDGAVARKYVYFTEVKTIPNKDLATMERLWVKYSNGQFGYSVQKEVYNSITVRQDFEKFCRKVGWNKMDNGIERKLKWFGNSEFIYDLKAPKGHLPLTNAIRGTTLLKELINHPVWDTNWRD